MVVIFFLPLQIILTATIIVVVVISKIFLGATAQLQGLPRRCICFTAAIIWSFAVILTAYYDMQHILFSLPKILLSLRVK